MGGGQDRGVGGAGQGDGGGQNSIVKNSNSDHNSNTTVQAPPNPVVLWTGMLRMSQPKTATCR